MKDIANNSPFTSTASSFGFKTDADQSTSSKEVAKSSGETVTTHNSLAVMFGAAPGEWDSSTCMVRNKASEENCIACGTAGASKTSSEKNASKDKERASNVENSTTSIAKQFAPAKGSWSCETCMIINQADTSKCVACGAGKPETGKSGSLESGSQKEQSSDLKRRFAAPANTWECEVCMIRNTQGQVKCAACDAKRPGCMTTENDLKVRFAAPAGSWDCVTCMITNQPSAVKCVACQTSKPGGESKAGTLMT